MEEDDFEPQAKSEKDGLVVKELVCTVGVWILVGELPWTFLLSPGRQPKLFAPQLLVSHGVGAAYASAEDKCI